MTTYTNFVPAPCRVFRPDSSYSFGFTSVTADDRQSNGIQIPEPYSVIGKDGYGRDISVPARLVSETEPASEPWLYGKLLSLNTSGDLETLFVHLDLLHKMQGSQVGIYHHTETGISAFRMTYEVEQLSREGCVFTTWDMGTVIGSYDDLYEADDQTLFVDEDARDEYNDAQNNNPENFRDDYHRSAHGLQYLRFGLETPRQLIGLEIEKEDAAILRMLRIDDFKDTCPKWKKESDGSLNRDSGFELISPAMEFDTERIIEHISANSTLKAHVEADYSDNCGMHANISDTERTPWELFDDISGYLPILCALYPRRATNNYCRAKTKVQMVVDSEKYQAFSVKTDRVEIRIFPAVTDLRNLGFRLRLIHHMMNNPAPNPRLVNLEALEPILAEVHKNDKAKEQFETRLLEWTQRLRS